MFYLAVVHACFAVEVQGKSNKISNQSLYSIKYFGNEWLDLDIK